MIAHSTQLLVGGQLGQLVPFNVGPFFLNFYFGGG